MADFGCGSGGGNGMRLAAARCADAAERGRGGRFRFLADFSVSLFTVGRFLGAAGQR